LFPGSQSFGDVWPLKDTQRINIIECGTVIVRKMNILALPEERWKEEKTGEESGTTDGRRDTGTGSKPPSETTKRKKNKRLKSFLHSSPPSEQLSPSISQPLAKSRTSFFHRKIVAIKESISLKLHGNPSPFDFDRSHCNELL